MKLRTHIVANGPSWVKFLESERKFRRDDIYGCNMGHDGIKMKAVFVHDARVLRFIERSKELHPHPIIAEQRFFKLYNNKYITQHTILPPECKERSSGHDALHYLIHTGEYKDIHLWGFDSLTSSTVESITKDKIPDSREAVSMLPKWLERFKELFLLAENSGISVVIH